MRPISLPDLRAAILRANLPPDTLPRILAALPDTPAAPAFEAAHIAYYLGALLIIGAMGWFVTSAWDTLPGLALTAIALLYALVFGAAGLALYRKPSTKVPGGLLTAVAVCMTPLAVYGIERTLHWWPALDPGGYARFHPWINGSWVLMEAATILVAAIALKFVRFPFLTAPAAYALWYMSMDLPAMLLDKTWAFHQECFFSIGFGLAMLLIAYLAEGEPAEPSRPSESNHPSESIHPIHPTQDFAFWFYLFGLLTFSGGLTLLGDGRQLGKLFYCLIHLTLILLSILLQRRAFLVFGALGVFIFLADEATNYFKNSFSFTLALTLIGAAFIAAGIFYKRHEPALTARLAPLIPSRLRHRHASAA